LHFLSKKIKKIKKWAWAHKRRNTREKGTILQEEIKEKATIEAFEEIFCERYSRRSQNMIGRQNLSPDFCYSSQVSLSYKLELNPRPV
jgi:hypothetical protein